MQLQVTAEARTARPQARGVAVRATARAGLAHVSRRGARHASQTAAFSGSAARGALSTRSRAPGRQARRGAVRVTAVFERFTERAIKAMIIAQQETKKLGSVQVDTEHILLGLIAECQQSAVGSPEFMGTNISIDQARQVAKTLYGKAGPVKMAVRDLGFSPCVKAVFEASVMESKRLKVNFIGPEHILVAMLKMNDTAAARILLHLGVSVEAVKTEAMRRIAAEADAELGRDPSRAPSRPATAASSSKAGAAPEEEEGPSALDEFATDLTERAAAGKIDPVIGREDETERVIQVLGRRQKNNPILLGDPGVGKTAIAEGLALCIVRGTTPSGEALPEFLREVRVMQVDVGLMVAGAKERGELEKRVTDMVREAREDPNVVLLIDEIHTVVGAGSASRGSGGGLDISNLLKPALARGELRCIGATTLDEHRKHIEKDPALERRFQPIMIDEPTEGETADILKGLLHTYEHHHGVKYTPEALEACVALSSRYIQDRKLPDKAMDVLDEAGSRARIIAHESAANLPLDTAEVAERQRRRTADGQIRGPASSLTRAQHCVARREFAADLRGLQLARDEAAARGHYRDAARLQEQVIKLESTQMGRADQAAMLPVVDVDDIEHVVAEWSGVPVQKLHGEEMERLQTLEGRIKDHVVGQDVAVEAVCRAMLRARTGLKDAARPIASMMFCGPTGVGKTELSRALAEEYFGDREAMIRLDMSEYLEKHSTSKLIGSPPGYVGYGDTSTLTEQVRRNPHRLVLLDEIEKAHPDVLQILLQVLEDGRLTDSMGRTVSFKDTLIVLTSNIGSAQIAGGGSQLGFDIGAPGETAAEHRHARVRELVMDELKAHYRPELLNRLDEVVVFHHLTQPDIAHIVDLELDKTRGRLAQQSIGLELTQRAVDFVVAEGFDPEYGARPVRRAVQSLVEDKLSDALLTRSLRPGDVAVVDADGVSTCVTSKAALASTSDPDDLLAMAGGDGDDATPEQEEAAGIEGESATDEVVRVTRYDW
ncbi:unnamed protein product [Pedinophyceae sp. YPF-701]|nr:unnamed protein product [Pedinophyceae sp. YPF-701]